MVRTSEAIEVGGRAELREWYLGHLRPTLLEAVGDGILEPGAVEELDYQLADLLGLPEDLAEATA
jgi:hypothetical protein